MRHEDGLAPQDNEGATSVTDWRPPQQRRLPCRIPGPGSCARIVASIVAAAAIGSAQAHDSDDSTRRPLRTPRGRSAPATASRSTAPTSKHRAIDERKVALGLGLASRSPRGTRWSAIEEESATCPRSCSGDPGCKTSPHRLDSGDRDQATWSAAVRRRHGRGNLRCGAGTANHGDKPFPKTADRQLAQVPGPRRGTLNRVSLSSLLRGRGRGNAGHLAPGIGAFTVTGHGFNCDRILVPDPDHPLLRRLTAKQLSNWGCSTHEAIDSVPAGFDTVATRLSGIPVLVAHTAT